MLSFAPRIPPLLHEALARLDDSSVPIAETNRRLGAEAARLGVTRPSYQRVRVLVHELRALRRASNALHLRVELSVRRTTDARRVPPRARATPRLGWLTAAVLVTLCYLAGFARASARPP